jgi:phosphoribosylamine--glycine ligase
MEKVKNQVIIPTVKGLVADGIEYQGFIFFGLIKVAGDPYVIEYNCRLGDPEAEVIIPRIKSDLLHFFDGIASGTLSECDLEIDEKSAAAVMLTSGGYPEKYSKGMTIHGLDDTQESILFHAGTKPSKNGTITSGGRVLAVTSYGTDIDNALEKAYKSAEKIKFTKKYLRSDIGFDLKKTPQRV